ncbi:MAG: amidohydrolase [Anaerolineae bacterium]
MRINLILRNGKVHTMDRGKPLAQAVAMAEGKIVAVGDDKEIEKEIGIERLSGPETDVIDLQGKTVIPGFTDAHVHFGDYALSLDRANLDGAKSLEEALARVEVKIEELEPGHWVQGWGWNHNDWIVPEFPTKKHLDRIAPHHPVALHRKDGHSVWVNSLALERAGISADTPDPAGGQIDRDPQTGEPTGILRERAMELVEDVIPRPTERHLQQALKEAMAKAHELGVTAVHNMEGADVFAALQALHGRGELKLRFCVSVPSDDLDEAIKLGLRTGFGDDWLRIGCVKMFADGSLGSQTALMLEPFEGQPDNLGIVVNSKEEIKDWVHRALKAGLATAIHAIGDRANREVLDVYEEELRPESGLRCRIEHVQLLHSDDIPRFAKLGVIASMQPIHATSDMLAADKFWGKRSKGGYAWRSLLDSGARLAFGSDCPVEPLDPLLGVHAAVTRRRADGTPPGGWYPEQRITVDEAVYGFTMGAAYASGEEASKGSITVGKVADLVVLSQDIFTVDPMEILNTRVDYTIFAGEVVYDRGGR